jgi:hypothetical protein
MLPESKLNPGKVTVYFGKQQTKAAMPGVCTLAGRVYAIHVSAGLTA